MTSPKQPTELLDATMKILAENETDSTPQRGTGVIDQWLVQLRQTDNATGIENSLERVKTQLKSDQIDAGELSHLLSTLAAGLVSSPPLRSAVTQLSMSEIPSIAETLVASPLKALMVVSTRLAAC